MFVFTIPDEGPDRVILEGLHEEVREKGKIYDRVSIECCVCKRHTHYTEGYSLVTTNPLVFLETITLPNTGRFPA